MFASSRILDIPDHTCTHKISLSPQLALRALIYTEIPPGRAVDVCTIRFASTLEEFETATFNAVYYNPATETWSIRFVVYKNSG